jgi:hypothetical protein
VTATHTQPRRSPPSPNGHGPRSVVDVHPAARRVRVPELVAGLLVVVVFALGAVLWHLSAIDKVPALVVASPVARGDVLETGDVRVGYVARDDGLARLDVTQFDRVVGRVAVVDLAEGTLLASSMMAEAAAIGDGDGVVGLSLEPGAYPTGGLAPGDRVNVVRAADTATTPAAVVARDATVFAVEELTSDRRLVSILTSETDAEAVAASAIGNGGLRLVVVAP